MSILLHGVSMGDRVKTTIVVDRELWSRFKAKLLERGVDEVSPAVEELIREELLADMVIDALISMAGGGLVQEVKPVRPAVETDAGRAVRELRESRY
jgi:hypothetical protein